ncbi:MAG: response regulator transcription factor [Nitrospira sp.]|nr:response regulator transcription factor [Nitrospira sp.]
MTDTVVAMPTLTIAILSSQCLVWLGLQKILERSATIPMVVHLHKGRTHDLLFAESRPDIFILDLETQSDALGTIKQIRESAPTSKVVLLCGLEDKDRMREAFVFGVEGIILKVQPPEVVLAIIESLYAPVKPHTPARGLGLATPFKDKVDSDPQPPAWPEALTEREREIICLVRQGLSNKDIAYTLSISDSTVRHHMTSIFDKVGVPNRQKLLVHAHQLRSTPVSPPIESVSSSTRLHPKKGGQGETPIDTPVCP